MAQAIAAYANANQIDSGAKVEIGFLVSSRKYKCEFSVFEQGMALTINVEKIYKDESGLSAFDCNIFNNDQKISSARINVFQPENPQQFLAEQL